MRAVDVIHHYELNPAKEYWQIASPLTGDDGKDYSFIARFIVTIAGDKIHGFGNANGYSLGTFFLEGTRSGDNLEFQIVSQNRYRLFELNGRGIYMDGDTKIGGNSLIGRDYVTSYNDPINYTGNFTVIVKPVSAPKPNKNYSGKLQGSYNSIENGTIKLRTGQNGETFLISELTGNLVSSTQSAGSFSYINQDDVTDIEIKHFKFSYSGSIGQDVVQIKGAFVEDTASGFVLIQRSGETYIGAFSALLE